MHGPDFDRPSKDVIDVVSRGSTASVTTVMREHGIENSWMDIYPLIPGQKMVGPAVTIRTVPGRGDVEPNCHTPGTLFPRHPEEAIDTVQPGDVVVQDGGALVRGGIFGDLLTLRLEVRGAAGLVTDMPIRDAPRVRLQPVPVFARACQAPGSLVFNPDFNIPIGCAGVLVFPGDLIVGDDDGVVVIPKHLIGAVVDDILTFEDREDWIRLMLRRGEPLQGLYPPNDEMERRFQEWRASQLDSGHQPVI